MGELKNIDELERAKTLYEGIESTLLTVINSDYGEYSNPDHVYSPFLYLDREVEGQDLLYFLREVGGCLVNLGRREAVLEEAKEAENKEETLLHKIIQLHNSILDKYDNVVGEIQARIPDDFEERMQSLNPELYSTKS